MISMLNLTRRHLNISFMTKKYYETVVFLTKIAYNDMF